MLVLGMAFTFAAYSVGSYGWVLIKGFNITPRQWWSPLHPYTWPPGGTPDPIPDTQLWPAAASQGGTASSGTPAGPGTQIV